MIQSYLITNIVNTKIITKKDIDRSENNNTFYQKHIKFIIINISYIYTFIYLVII